MADEHPGLRRLLRDPEVATGVERLLQLNGQDLTTVLLHLLGERTTSTAPVDVLAGSQGRFTVPSPIAAGELASLRSAAFDALDGFDAIELAPVVPLGTHAALGGVDQNNVVSAVRGLELAADPTVGLAIEAANRRRALLDAGPRSDTSVRLATSQRITRAQRFDGPRSFAHFELTAAVVAGRAGPGRSTEVASATDLLRPLCEWTARTAGAPVLLRLTGLDDTHDVITQVGEALASPTVHVEAWPDRVAGGAYYSTMCFKLGVDIGTEMVEVGDGGFVDWTARMLENRKERLVTGAVSLERLAMISSSS